MFTGSSHLLDLIFSSKDYGRDTEQIQPALVKPAQRISELRNHESAIQDTGDHASA